MKKASLQNELTFFPVHCPTAVEVGWRGKNLLNSKLATQLRPGGWVKMPFIINSLRAIKICS